MNPLFNHFEGLASDATGHRPFADGSMTFRRSLRRTLFGLLSGLGILKDISTIFFLAYFCWRRCPPQFDMATGLGPWGAVAGIGLRAIKRTRFLVYEDRDYEPGFIHTPLRRRWAAMLERYAMRRADRVIAIGGRLAALRRRQTGRAIDIVPTGVDAIRFACPERHGPRPVLLYSGNMAPWCGLDVVIRALPRIRRSIPDVRCVFVGTGPGAFLAHLKTLAADLNVLDIVQFVGEVTYDRVPSYLAEAGLGLALFQPTPLRRYAAPLKVLEYMAAGLPTIATRRSEAADLVNREDAGIAVAFDQDALSEAVIGLIEARDIYTRLAANAMQAAVKYSWPTLMTAEYNILTEIYVDKRDF